MSVISDRERVGTQRREEARAQPEVPPLQWWAEELLSPDKAVAATPKMARGIPGKGGGVAAAGPTERSLVLGGGLRTWERQHSGSGGGE